MFKGPVLKLERKNKTYCIRTTTSSQDEQRLIVYHNLMNKHLKSIIYFTYKTQMDFSGTFSKCTKRQVKVKTSTGLLK